MAKLLMGAIVVKASGKINGNCFRTFRGQQLLTRLALPTKTNLFRSNPQNGIMAQAFRSWGLLDDAGRTAWAVIASENPVIDIWGNPKLLSGREFYTKTVSVCVLCGISVPSWEDFVKDAPSIVCTSLAFQMTDSKLSFVDLVVSAGAFLEVRFVKLPNSLNNYSLAKTNFNFSLRMDSLPDSGTMFDSIKAGTPLIVVAWYQFYIAAVSPSGVRSGYISFLVRSN